MTPCDGTQPSGSPRWCADLTPGGEDLLLGELKATIKAGNGPVSHTAVRLLARLSGKPGDDGAARQKLADCVTGLDTDPTTWIWDNAADVLRSLL